MPNLPPTRGPVFARASTLLLAARDLMQRIHTDFTYESQSTEINTPALQALAQRKGVCQDFAHIMIACLRAYGLPARYVSGYLLTQPRAGPATPGGQRCLARLGVGVPARPAGRAAAGAGATSTPPTTAGAGAARARTT